MPYRVIHTADDMADLAKLLGNLDLPITVEWIKGLDRKKRQNRLQWKWAGEAANQLGDRDPADVQAEWKLTKGVPILRSDSAEFRDVYDAGIRPQPYPQKIDLMKLGFPVTSRMKVRQMARFLNAVQQECSEMGLRLTDPDPDLAQYNSRYRANPPEAQR